ncbi:MAG: hypothetical protein RL594_1176 [Bacteroidota bacterium]|jgi:uncharacterized protein (DUF1501 family)
MKTPTLTKGLSRRSFIARATGAVTLPMILNGLPLQAFDGPVLHDLYNVEAETDRVLVLVQLNGGNDGLNTVLPLKDYSTYQKLRTNIAIPERSGLKLTDEAALHPSMTGLQELWNEQKLGIIQGVSYPNPNLSHFRSTDIWMSASASNVNETTGWLGRYLNLEYPDYPAGFPNATMPDPIAIQMAAVVGLTLTGLEHQSMGIALQDPETFYRLVSGTDAPGSDLPSTKLAASNITYVREVQSKSMQFSAVIKAAADKAKNIETYPTGNRLADQLKIVARLIAGGLKTRVYVVQLGGFDTHAGQTDATEPTMGTHANLLQQVSAAMTTFQRDIEKLGVAERVIAMTFSEFGRRSFANESYGTDHGTSAPMFFLGNLAQDGITGTSPKLTGLKDGNLETQYDFRQIYASILEQWFGAKKSVVKQVLFDSFDTVKVIKGQTTSVDETPSASTQAFTLAAVAPNPVRSDATISYDLHTEGLVHMNLFDNLGLHVATLVSEYQSSGPHSIPVSASPLPSGSYVIELRMGNERAHKVMVVAR